MIEKYSSANCKSDDECTIVVEIDRCAADCGTALALTVAHNLTSNLGNFADENCSTCPPVPIPPCPAIRATCAAGLCRTATY
jgi:hypothetical protein